MVVYSFSTSEIEEVADTAKVTVLKALVDEGLLDTTVAEEWAKTHTLMYRKKNIFRTLGTAWKNATEIDGFYLTCVKAVVPKRDDQFSQAEK